MSTTDRKSLTFYAKEGTECPICSSVFFHEDLRRGRGRLISGQLTDELHQQYVASSKYGKVYPLIYPIYTCPHCYYAAFKKDFEAIDDKTKKNLTDATQERKQVIESVVADVNFNSARGLPEGLASYILALLSYDSFPDAASPVFKQGVCALRAGWLCIYMHEQFPNQQYLYLHKHLMRKAAFLYNHSFELEQKKKQIVPMDFFVGPDVDRNYGYDGIIYLNGLLEYRYGAKHDARIRHKRLSQIRINIGRVFGFGRSSKEKPSAILNLTKELYEVLSTEVQMMSVSG